MQKIYSVSTNKRGVGSMSFSSSTSSWKPQIWVRLDLVFTVNDIYSNSNPNQLTKVSSSYKSTKFKDSLTWDVSQVNEKNITIRLRIIIRCTMKRSIPFWVWKKVHGNWDNNMARISHWMESYRRTNTRVRREK